MCGICGILHLHQDPRVDPVLIEKMNSSQKHRGPDDMGFYFGEGIGLGATRLSIQDLSKNGHMPMPTPDGRYHIVFNGEIYNFNDIRKELESSGDVFRSRTDTEVILYTFRKYGPSMLDRFNGMFSIAIWDSVEQSLFIARDRFGVKPLYYTIWNNSLIFASEEKALFSVGVPAVFNEKTWEELLIFRHTAGSRTPYQGIYRLLPGHYLLVNNRTVHEPKEWWRLSPGGQDQAIEYREAVEKLRSYMEDSIRFRRISDVPVGTMLSGGIDSSVMTSIMAGQSDASVHSFTMRFENQDYDEGPLASLVAERYGLTHHELFAKSGDMPQLLVESAEHLDEPIVHGNDIYILAIAKYARSLVTVLLSGEGADEVLGGYVRYRSLLHIQSYRAVMPFLRMISLLSDNRRIEKMTSLFKNKSIRDMVLYSSASVYPDEIMLKITENFEYRNSSIQKARELFDDPVRQAMYYEQQTYLQTVLERNDRMTMGASIECREPYLDYRMVEWLSTLPTDYFFTSWSGKRMLRDIGRSLCPPEIVHHRKWGFGVPWQELFLQNDRIKHWLGHFHEAPVFENCPIPVKRIDTIIKNFLSGDQQQTQLVIQLAFFMLWYQIRIERKSDIFN